MPAIRPGGKFPHEPLEVGGVWGYATPFSVQAGNTVDFRISNDEPVTVNVCRLVSPRTQNQDVILKEAVLEVKKQPIYPSSYAAVENKITTTFTKGCTIEVWIRPFQDQSDVFSGVVTQFARCEEDELKSSCGFGIFLLDNFLHVYFGDGGEYDNSKMFAFQDQLAAEQWYHVVAVWNPAASTQVMVSVTPASASKLKFQTWEAPYISQVKGGDTYLRFGAAASIVKGSEFSSNFASIDIAMPVIYNRALDVEEVVERFFAKGRVGPAFEDSETCVEGVWTFEEEVGNYVADSSKNKRTGTIINRATWRIGGPCTAALELKQQFQDPKQFGHGLRFQQDELVDCMWDVSLSYHVPANALPGVYAAKLYNNDGLLMYAIHFNVRRADLGKPADVVVLSSSNTWFAYSSGFGAWHHRSPGYSFYDFHNSGVRAYTRSYNMPLFQSINATFAPGYIQLVKNERYVHEWLRLNNYDYDSITDWDLTMVPEILSKYKVLLIAGHSEYWTREAFEAVKKFLDHGGKVLGATGNTMYWRVSFDDDGILLEGRKLPAEGVSSMGLGESVHQNDGEIAGLAGQCNMRSEEVLGVTCPGWSIDHLTWKMVNRAEMYPPEYAKDYEEDISQILHGVTAEEFGFADSEGAGTVGCVMHEGDVPLDYLYQSPLTYPERPPAIIARSDSSKSTLDVVEYSGKIKRGTGLLKYGSTVTYWKRPQGGFVFHFGAIGAGWGLYYDKEMQKMANNVLQLWNIKPQLH